MYHDEIGFDALALSSPLDSAATSGPAAVLEQDFAGRLLGLVLASDLFAARRSAPRQRQDGLVLATCWPDAEIRFSGDPLDQDDLDALLGCLLLAFRAPATARGSARFALRDLTRLLRPKGRRFDALRLEGSLWRLAAARIDIREQDGVRMQARLFNTLLCDSSSGICAVDVNQRILSAFGDAGRVERLVALRAPLGSDGFRRWLAGLLLQGPASLRLDYQALRRLSGLSRQPMTAFRVRAVAALQDFLDLGVLASVEPAGPDRCILSRPAARGEQAACLLLS